MKIKQISYVDVCEEDMRRIFLAELNKICQGYVLKDDDVLYQEVDNTTTHHSTYLVKVKKQKPHIVYALKLRLALTKTVDYVFLY